MNAPILNSHAKSIETIFDAYSSTKKGVTSSQAAERLRVFGPNILPTKPPPTLLQVFFHQFQSPLIYILGIAAFVSAILGDFSDAAFILVVLALNALIGCIQEFSAEKSAQALKSMEASTCAVERDSRIIEIAAEKIVPGDVVVLDSGKKVPADLRLFQSQGLEIDESLLTGESMAVVKDHSSISQLKFRN